MRPSLSLLAASAIVATAGLAQAADYAIDPTHTFVTFEIDHFGVSTNRGRFDKKEGTLSFDRVAKTGKVDIIVDTNSVNTGTPAFDKHLNSDQILDTAAHPKARFVSEKFTFDGDKLSEVTGQFTLKGKTNPVTLKATKFGCYDHPRLKREVCGGDFVATIDRSLWGADFGVAFGIPKEMRLVIQVEAVKQ
jgi:polyisoprenoid-binding protein YceI